MLLDARTVPTGSMIETDLCIVGGGAAGISLAREFVNSPFRVTLLESGSMASDPATQELYSGSDIGRPYKELSISRSRYFGGTTDRWGGWCLPFDDVEMEARDGIPHGGWPFRPSYLEPWYRRAQEVCELGPYEYSPARWGIDPNRTPPPFNGPHFITRVLQQGPPTRFGTVYEPELRRASGVSVHLNANAMRCITDERDRAVRELQVGTLSGGRFSVRARAYILAGGGIENARILLLSGNGHGRGLGNEHDLVGRYFMVHLLYGAGEVVLANPRTDFDFYTGRDGIFYEGFGKPWKYVSFIGLSPQTMRDRKLPGIKVNWLYKFAPSINAIKALKRVLGREHETRDLGLIAANLGGIADFAIRKALFGQGVPVESISVNCSSEQLPNPDSRICLAAETDALGLRQVAVDWHLTPEDKLNALSTIRLLKSELERTGFGQFHVALEDDDYSWPTDMRGDEHHSGTTRMHPDPKQGVVDENCRVHSVHNLYVAGSSVFPNIGASNPTLTIIALALRLADHLKQKLA